jgi:hypothetical protein
MQTTIQAYLLISYREDLDVLFLRWSTPVSSSKLRSGYLQALEEAAKLKVRCWLFDLRSRGMASAADEKWLLKEFFPLVEKKLGHSNAFAYLVSPSHYAYIRDEVGIQMLANYSAVTSIRPFVSEGEALQWLSQCRHSLQKSA